MGSDSKFSPVDYNHTPDEMLQHLVEQGIINLSDVDKSMKQKELDKVLQNHPYSIYKDNRGAFLHLRRGRKFASQGTCDCQVDRRKN